MLEVVINAENYLALSPVALDEAGRDIFTKHGPFRKGELSWPSGGRTMEAVGKFLLDYLWVLACCVKWRCLRHYMMR
jgi:hypothetical protein